MLISGKSRKLIIQEMTDMKKKILYYEDEKHYAKSLVEAIQSKNKNIINTVYTPSDFFKEINSDKSYNLFILDILVPLEHFLEDDINKLTEKQQLKLENGLNVGIVFYEILRDMAKYKETPVIFLTSKSYTEFHDPKVRYFSKPVNWETIITAIDELI